MSNDKVTVRICTSCGAEFFDDGNSLCPTCDAHATARMPGVLRDEQQAELRAKVIGPAALDKKTPPITAIVLPIRLASMTATFRSPPCTPVSLPDARSLAEVRARLLESVSKQPLPDTAISMPVRGWGKAAALEAARGEEIEIKIKQALNVMGRPIEPRPGETREELLARILRDDDRARSPNVFRVLYLDGAPLPSCPHNKPECSRCYLARRFPARATFWRMALDVGVTLLLAGTIALVVAGLVAARHLVSP